MKPRHWMNLFGVGLAAALLAWLALSWAEKSFAEPTCRRFGHAQGLTYVGYRPPDWYFRARNSGPGRDGNCDYRRADGTSRVVGLVTATDKAYGAPLVVAFALQSNVVFLWAFIAAALLRALITRMVSGRKPD